eukprot:s1994_g3.t3
MLLALVVTELLVGYNAVERALYLLPEFSIDFVIRAFTEAPSKSGQAGGSSFSMKPKASGAEALGAGKLANAYTVKPSSGIIPAESEKEMEVHFAPNEVENFDCTLFGSSSMIDGGKPVIRLPLTGSALRPWCHLEVPASDYRSRRQSDAPLDPKYHILEIVSLGTHVKNTKRFYVMNPTAEPLDFIWQPEVPLFSSSDASDDECFKCLTKRGTILPNKKFEMSFEPKKERPVRHATTMLLLQESFWSFVLLGPKVEEHFLVAGTVQEPRIGMDKLGELSGQKPLVDSAAMAQPAPWVPDEEVSECPLCTQKFSSTKRKHHCRACGREERVCDSCFDLLQHDKGRPVNEQFLELKRIEASLKADLREKQQQEEWFRSFLTQVSGQSCDDLPQLISQSQLRWRETCQRMRQDELQLKGLEAANESSETELRTKAAALETLQRQELTGLRQRSFALEASFSSSSASMSFVSNLSMPSRMEGCRRPCINFGERLLQGVASESVLLVNKERDAPKKPEGDREEWQLEEEQEGHLLQCLQVQPKHHQELEMEELRPNKPQAGGPQEMEEALPQGTWRWRRSSSLEWIPPLDANLQNLGYAEANGPYGEHIPFSFQIDPASFQEEGGLQALSISPMNGVVGPDSSVSIHVNFKPLEERPFNFNIACNIKRKKEPVILNVKGLGYKIHASLAIEEPAGRRIINSGVLETLDMGMLQVHERREVVLNDSKRNFNYRMQMLVGANRKPKPIGSFEKPPYIALSNPHGVAAHHEETPIELKYAPRDAHMLDGSILQVAIPAGPVEEIWMTCAGSVLLPPRGRLQKEGKASGRNFAESETQLNHNTAERQLWEKMSIWKETFSIALTGGAKRSRVEFSFLSHDFGPCFIARGGATMAGEPFAPSEDMRYERVELIATNRDDSDCLISSTFQREPWLDVQLNAAMIEAGGSLRIPIVFSPREVCEYMQRIEFIVNDYTRMHVDVRGRGCPLKLELTDSDMQNIDFGITRGNEPVSRQVRLVNRSPRPVTFQLSDEKELAEHAVSWTPAHPCTLRPRQTVEIELRFNPTYRIAPFRLPLLAKCEHGVEVRLLHMTGTCHAIEMRLSEHSVFFGDVVVGSQATKPVRLHNFGDLGAKFRFEIGSKYGKIFSVTPSEGFVRPQEDINLMVAFHPTHERIMEYKRADKHARKSKLDPKDVNIGITVRDIRCVLEGHPPLMLEASGKCVSQPGETKLLEFFAQVRTKTQNSFVINNPTDSDWKLYPQVATQEPPGTSYFSCEKDREAVTFQPGSEIVVPAKKDATLQVYYMPLTMTAAGDATGSPSSGKPRVEKHKGTIFLGSRRRGRCCHWRRLEKMKGWFMTPDGNAVCYELEGEATPPEVNSRLEAKVPCKKKHTQAVPVKNWLHERF